MASSSYASLNTRKEGQTSPPNDIELEVSLIPIWLRSFTSFSLSFSFCIPPSLYIIFFELSSLLDISHAGANCKLSNLVDTCWHYVWLHLVALKSANNLTHRVEKKTIVSHLHQLSILLSPSPLPALTTAGRVGKEFSKVRVQGFFLPFICLGCSYSN